MDIGLSPELIGIGLSFVVAWLFLTRMRLPTLRRRFADAKIEDLPALARHLAGTGVLRDVAVSGVIAFVVVLTALAALNLYVSRIAADEAGLVGLMELRQQADLLVERVRDASIATWAVVVVILGLIWLAVSRNRARRSWHEAIEARREALTSRAGDLDLASLRVAAERAAPGMPALLDARVASLIDAGQNALRDALAAKALHIGQQGDSVPVSLDDLSVFRDELRAMAAGGSGGADGDDNRPEKAADALDAQIRRLKSEIVLDLRGLTGPIQISLTTAETSLEQNLAPEAARRRELTKAYVDKTLVNHVAEGRARAGSEPESLREWIFAGGTSEAMIRSAGRTGRVARYGAMVAFFLGFVGLGATALGNGVTASLMEAELGLASRLSADSVAATAARNESSEQTPDASDLASDAATETILRATMRASFSRAIQHGVMTRSNVPTFAPRQHFNLASVNARQQILTASARPAAAAPDGVRATASYTVSGVQASDHLPINAVLNPPIDERIAQLRANESVWTSLRASAARPAPPDLAAEQFLRVALADDAMLRSHQVQLLADQLTTDVARVAARSGAIPHGYTPDIRANVAIQSLSARDQRIVTDFESRSAGRASRYVDDTRFGHIDPGSLHRVAPGAAIRTGGATSAYADLFPAALDTMTSGGGEADGRRAGGTRVASKSYRAVRFNPQVGGVVIGREPETIETLDITGFEWQVSSSRMRIALVDAGGLQHDLGLFDPAIVHHALAYAADGRVVTSTLPASAADEVPLDVPARRVVVHPAFEDTKFACAAIQIDRFVDSVMFGDDWSEEAAPLVDARMAVTGFSQILQYAGPPENTPAILEQFGTQLQAAFDHAKICGIGEECFPVAAYANYGLRFGEADGLLACFKDNAEPADCAPHLTGLYSETTYSVDSGVRESAYDIDSSLDFLTGNGSAHDSLWPLDFIVQAVPQPIGNASMETSEDWEPWIFPQMADTLRFLIAKEVSANAGAQAVFEDMREFVVLQRLFRSALEGHLGLDFPLHTLIDMQHATSEYVVVERQEHWNANKPFFDFLSEETRSLMQSIEQEVTAGAATPGCQVAMQSALGAAVELEWPEGPGIWSTLDEVERACSLSRFQDLGRRIAALREMDIVDEALHISATMDRPRAPLSCN